MKQIIASLFFLLAMVSTQNVLALEANDTTTEVPRTCSEEVRLYCEKEETPKSKAQCLFANIDKLSESCRQEIKRFIRAVEQAQEQTGDVLVTPSALNSVAPPFTVISLDLKHIPGDNTLNERRIGLSTPLQQKKDSSLVLTLSGGEVQFNQPISLGTETTVPDRLNRAELGLQYSQRLPEFKSWGLRASVGSAGDRLFHKTKDTTFNIIANYGSPSKAGGFWMWTLFFSNNSPLGNSIPIPGFLYIYKTPTFTGLFGVPTLSLQWTPTAEQAYSLSLLGLTATTEAAFGEIRTRQYFTTVKWTNQSFMLSDRKEEKDRLTIEEKKAGLGIRSFLWGRMLTEAEGGYAFDRLIYSGSGLRNMRGGSAELQDDWYASLNFKAGF